MPGTVGNIHHAVQWILKINTDDIIWNNEKDQEEKEVEEEEEGREKKKKLRFMSQIGVKAKEYVRNPSLSL